MGTLEIGPGQGHNRRFARNRRFGAWLEQLIAESTGKQGHGLIPVDAEPLAGPDAYGNRIAYSSIFGSTARPMPAKMKPSPHSKTRSSGGAHQCYRHYHIGQEFFRWEIATAVAGSILAINPFNQPDVEASKIKTRELTDAFEAIGKLPFETPILEQGELKLFTDARNREALGKAATLRDYLAAHFHRIEPGDYCALLAYVERNERHREVLQEIRALIRNRKHIATCVGFGPRFLHSTGQAYKGGPNTGIFLQITCDDPADLKVPGQTYTFSTIKAAQAQGDFEVLAERGRRVLRVHLGAHVMAGLTALKEAVGQALS